MLLITVVGAGRVPAEVVVRGAVEVAPDAVVCAVAATAQRVRAETAKKALVIDRRIVLLILE
jgi:hypothetical protein